MRAPSNHLTTARTFAVPVQFVSSLEAELGGAAGRFGQLTVAAVRRWDGSRVATKKIGSIGHQLCMATKRQKWLLRGCKLLQPAVFLSSLLF
jgi:hypothetical protein